METLEKFDKKFTSLYNSRDWSGILLRLFLFTLFYTFIYWSPEILMWQGLNPVKPLEHEWHMTIANSMGIGFILMAAFQAVQIVKHKHSLDQENNT